MTWIFWSRWIALSAAGFEMVAHNDSLHAWGLLSGTTSKFDVLVTRVGVIEGTTPGLALAGHFRVIRPGAPVIITGMPDNAHFADGLGRVLVAPIAAQDLVAAERSALAGPAAESG